MTCEPFVSPEKISKYLLNFDHPEGRGKASFFISYGFKTEKPEILASFLIQHYLNNNVSDQCQTLYGIKQTIQAKIKTPDGRIANVISVWVVSDDNRARLITAYPSDP